MSVWPETQKKLEEKMSGLLALAAAVCETAPRPMRLPRSIAPSQWLEFLEGHLTLFLATLEAQDIKLATTVNLEDAPRQDVEARTYLVTMLMEEIGETWPLRSAPTSRRHQPPPKPLTKRPKCRPRALTKSSKRSRAAR